MGIPQTALVKAPRPSRGGSGDDTHAPVIATALGAPLRVRQRMSSARDYMRSGSLVGMGVGSLH